MGEGGGGGGGGGISDFPFIIGPTLHMQVLS